MLDPWAIGVIAGGAALVVVGWGIFLLGRRRRKLARALADVDPVARLAALDVVAEHRVDPHLGVLVERALVENDQDVRAALVRTITQIEWEPGADRRLLQLKTWAMRVTSESAGTHAWSNPIADDSGAEPRHALSRRGVDTMVDDRQEQSSEFPTGAVRSGQPAAEAGATESARAGRTPVDQLAGPGSEGMNQADNGRSGGHPFWDEPPIPSSTIPVAKAEQAAIDLLRDAGYGVAPRSSPNSAEPWTVG